MKNVNEIHKDSLTLSEIVAKVITEKVGTMTCAVIFAILALISFPAAIMSGNAIIIVAWVAQTFLQLVLLPLILVGQNIQSKHSEMVADADYEADLKSERQVEEINKKLDSIIQQITK